jgi:hypothetical protein
VSRLDDGSDIGVATNGFTIGQLQCTFISLREATSAACASPVSHAHAAPRIPCALDNPSLGGEFCAELPCGAMVRRLPQSREAPAIVLWWPPPARLRCQPAQREAAASHSLMRKRRPSQTLRGYGAAITNAPRSLATRPLHRCSRWRRACGSEVAATTKTQSDIQRIHRRLAGNRTAGLHCLAASPTGPAASTRPR